MSRGTLTYLRKQIKIHQEIQINEDFKLLRIIVHGNKILWLGNTYLSLGKSCQLRKLFQVLRYSVPKEEWNRIVLIGDFNIDVNQKNDSRYILLKSLAKEMSLEILEPPQCTFNGSKLDFALVSKELKGSVHAQDLSLSDHLPLSLSINLPIVNNDYSRLQIPNRKLADIITIATLQEANSSREWILKHNQQLARNLNRTTKRVMHRDYERKLLDKLLEKENAPIIETINEYWRELLEENEHLRFSCESAKAFDQLRKIFGYHKFEKRDGGIVSCILKDGQIVHDSDSVNAALIAVLRDIQVDPYVPIPSAEPFPNLPNLSQEEAERLIDRMASDKAISFDLFSDIIFSNCYKAKTAEVIRDLWNSDVTEQLSAPYFEARLVPLNKKYPNVPKAEEFRPIIVLSPIIKILEARLLMRLQDYLVQSLHRSQIGFIPGMDVFVNIHRALKQIRARTSFGKHVFCLFLDFKSAYNTIPHRELFQKLENVCTKQEVQLIRAIYSRLTIRLGSERLRCNTGVAQGSMISPALFDIYAEELLIELTNQGWSIEDILAYADDHLIICDSVEELLRAINITKAWCKRFKIRLNPQKSGIVEMAPRRGKLWLKLGSYISEIPVLESYKYLGLQMDNKLTGDSHTDYE